MKLNYNTKICGSHILLVPYRKHHVPKYHQWMKSEELQRLTASEPLTLEEEYSMQKSWQEDENKCTFILLDKNKYDITQDEIESMIGDINIFITDKEAATGEIEIMIAEESARGKKLGWEAVILMLIYAIKYIQIEVFEAKISFDNSKSISMFTKLGFEEKTRSEVFQEITFVKNVTSDWLQWLESCYELKIQSH